MNGLPPLRTTPARYSTGRGWLWVRSGFDIFNKGMGISVAMVLVWFMVGMLLEQLPAGGLISQLLYMVWGAGWVAVAARGYRGAAAVCRSLRRFSPQADPVDARRSAGVAAV